MTEGFRWVLSSQYFVMFSDGSKGVKWNLKPLKQKRASSDCDITTTPSERRKSRAVSQWRSPYLMSLSLNDEQTFLFLCLFYIKQSVMGNTVVQQWTLFPQCDSKPFCVTSQPTGFFSFGPQFKNMLYVGLIRLLGNCPEVWMCVVVCL